MLKKLVAVTASIVLAASITVVSFDTAEARRHRHRGVYVGGAALGLFALGALGAQSGYAYGYDREGCYRGPRECRWVRGECYRDRYGNFECEESYRECYRPLDCD